MIFSASFADVSVLGAVSGARRRLGDISETLLVLRRQCRALAGQAQWESRAAQGFRIDADTLAHEVASLAAEVERIDDELRSAAVRADSSAGSWRP